MGGICGGRVAREALGRVEFSDGDAGGVNEWVGFGC